MSDDKDIEGRDTRDYYFDNEYNAIQPGGNEIVFITPRQLGVHHVHQWRNTWSTDWEATSMPPLMPHLELPPLMPHLELLPPSTRRDRLIDVINRYEPLGAVEEASAAVVKAMIAVINRIAAIADDVPVRRTIHRVQWDAVIIICAVMFIAAMFVWAS